MDMIYPVSLGVSSVESGDMNSPVSSGVVAQPDVSLVESGEVVPSDIPITLSPRFNR